MSDFFKKDVWIISLLYSLAHGLLLINNGVFWDDWTLVYMPAEVIIDVFHQNGVIWPGYVHSFLLSLDSGVVLYRLLTFLAFWAATLIFNNILRKIKEISDTDRLFITLIFATFPVNSARVALIDFPYTICYLAFFAGFWLVSRYVSTKQLFYKCAAIPLFALSFFTNSMIVFYSLVLGYVLYASKEPLTGAVLKRFFRGNLDLILMPVAFWLMKVKYFTPYGLYGEYNRVKISKLLTAPVDFAAALYTSFIAVLDVSLHSFTLSLLLIAVLLTLVCINRKIAVINNNTDKLWFFFGFLAFFLAVFPYNAVGKQPNLEDWLSRHQLLIPLGASFLLYFGFKLLAAKFELKEQIKLLVYWTFIMLFMATNINYYLAFQKDWYKQLSMLEAFRNSAVVRDNRTFLFTDNAKDLAANARTIRFYEYSAMMKVAFGDQSRFGHDRFTFTDISNYNKFFNKYYSLQDYVPTNPEYSIYIVKGDYELNNQNVLKMRYYEFAKSEQFKANITNLIRLKYDRL